MDHASAGSVYNPVENDGENEERHEMEDFIVGQEGFGTADLAMWE